MWQRRSKHTREIVWGSWSLNVPTLAPQRELLGRKYSVKMSFPAHLSGWNRINILLLFNFSAERRDGATRVSIPGARRDVLKTQLRSSKLPR